MKSLKKELRENLIKKQKAEEATVSLKKEFQGHMRKVTDQRRKSIDEMRKLQESQVIIMNAPASESSFVFPVSRSPGLKFSYSIFIFQKYI